MNKILGEMIHKNVMVYMDDIIIYSKEIEEHKDAIRTVIKKLQDHKFRINLDKIQYYQNKVNLLGMVIDGHEKTPIEERKRKVI